MTFVSFTDRVFDLIFGGREADRGDPKARAGRHPFAVVAPDLLLVDIIRLPANDIGEARAAISLQLDRLIPFDANSAAWDVVALDQPSPDEARRRFLFACAPSTHLSSIRDHASRGEAVEAFVAEVEAEGEAAHVVLYDPKAQAVRRRRRLRLAASALVSMLGCAALGLSFSDWRERLAKAETAKESSMLQRRIEAEVRARAAQDLQNEVRASTQGDALTQTLAIQAALATPPTLDLAIETLVVDSSGARLTGYTNNPQGLEASLRKRRDLSVRTFSAAGTPDPFGRGARFEAGLTVAQ